MVEGTVAESWVLGEHATAKINTMAVMLMIRVTLRP